MNIRQWFVYIVECFDSSLYTGITTNLERRIFEHNNSSKGAKYTKNRRPVKLVFSEIHQCRSSASKREIEIKKLSKQNKLKMLDKL